jgi:EAL domain-containing protein (putative c-di-GMP-specific phosphodiesterase class I)
MDAELQQRIELERILREAVAHDRFELHYQPLFEMSDYRLIGFEALIRLPRADGTLIPPLTFIPVAEDMRLLPTIGAWVLREACRTAMGWPDHLTIAVNLSPSQFSAGNVSAVVASALAETGLRPNRLELEITETLLLHDSDAIMAELRTLKAMGVAIVMDDSAPAIPASATCGGSRSTRSRSTAASCARSMGAGVRPRPWSRPS